MKIRYIVIVTIAAIAVTFSIANAQSIPRLPTSGSGGNFFTNLGSNTYLNKGSILQAPSLNATSTTAMSMFAGNVTVGKNIAGDDILSVFNRLVTGTGTVTDDGSGHISCSISNCHFTDLQVGYILEIPVTSAFVTVTDITDDNNLTVNNPTGASNSIFKYINPGIFSVTDSSGSKVFYVAEPETGDPSVGIDNVLPTSRLDIASGGNEIGLTLTNSFGSAPNQYGGLRFFNGYGTGGGGSPDLELAYIHDLTDTNYGTHITFGTKPNDGLAGASVTERMRLTDAGSLGVGTTSPGTLLSLGNTGANTINISATATSTWGSGQNIRTGCYAINGVCLSSSSGTSGDHWATTTAGDGIIPAGAVKVGIGTTSPYRKLSVSGDSSLSSAIFDGSVTIGSTTAGLVNGLTINTSGTPIQINRSGADSWSLLSGSGNQFLFRNLSLGAGAGDGLVLLNNGSGYINMGIDNTSPAFPLHIRNPLISGDFAMFDTVSTAAQEGRVGVGKVNDSGANNLNAQELGRFDFEGRNGGNTVIDAFVGAKYTGNGSTIKGDLTFNTANGTDLAGATSSSTERMRVTSGGNVGIGTSSPEASLTVNGTVVGNTFNSYTPTSILQLQGITQFSAPRGTNIFIGTSAGTPTVSQDNNVALGSNALQSVTSGSGNLAIGPLALGGITTGFNNVAVGQSADGQTNGARNIAIGSQAGLFNLSGTDNVKIGNGAGLGVNGNSNSNNTFLGGSSAPIITSGNSNVCIGYGSCPTLAGGSNDVVIGQSADVPTGSATNFLNVGNVLYGNTSTGFAGIGTTTPATRLDINTSVASSTPLLIENPASLNTGGCILIKDVAGVGYTQLYTQAGTLSSKVHTGSLSSCN